jgi:ABC-type Na+ efflux pump permease subunit
MNIIDSLYIAWAIASKDIVDALKHKSTRVNIIVLVGLVAFFYWGLGVRPFDQQVDVVVYDQGQSRLLAERAELSGGAVLTFAGASSLEEMERMMAYRDLGLVLPADFEQELQSGGEPVLSGYIPWVHRARTAALEAQYSAQLAELLNRPVQVRIGENHVIPRSGNLGIAATAAFHVMFAAFWMSLSIVPHLMLEERRARTMDALLVSPAGPGQVILGKAMAGMFYAILGGAFALLLNRAYIVDWGLALLAFLCSALFSIGLALVMGSLVRSAQQWVIWAQPVVFLLIVPAFFAQEPNLAAGLRAVLAWLPTTALTGIFGLAMSATVPPALFLRDLAVVLACIALVYATVVWQVRRSDR